MDQKKNLQFVNEFWDKNILPTLKEYIGIPNKSPQFDSHWQAHGYMDQAVQLIAKWCKTHGPQDMKLEVMQLAERTPLIFIEIPGNNTDTILLYGHLDKQPEMTGWDDDLHPFKATLREDKLFGRGAADDGYAVFASLTAILSLRAQNLAHARCLVLIEACEESGSYDLPFYIDALKDRIGTPHLVICLDSGCGNYDQLWVTTSLRGLVSGDLQIEVLRQGIHSGNGSGVVPSCFRILRLLLDRIENVNTGDMIGSDLQVDIPHKRREQAEQAAKVLGEAIFSDLPFKAKVMPESHSLTDLILRRTWQPALSIIGANDVPLIENAGNVTLPKLTVKLSMRLPPTCDQEKAAQYLKKILEQDPPYQAHVSFKIAEKGPGFNAPSEEPWLADALNNASQYYFGKAVVYLGEGGSIPFMGMLGSKFPAAQFVITGVLGPESNAHGPNEFLHIPTGKKLTACVAEIISRQYQAHNK